MQVSLMPLQQSLVKSLYIFYIETDRHLKLRSEEHIGK